MGNSRSINAARNAVAGIIYKACSVGFPFIIRTLMIKKMGAEYLGLSNLFSSILQVLSLAELGFGSAVVFSMYKPISEKNNDLICALYSFYRKVYRIIGVVVLIIGLLIVPFLPKLIKGGYPENINLYILYLIYLGNTVISYWMYAYKESLLIAHQRSDISSKLSTVVTLGMYFFQILTLIFVHNYYAYIFWLPLSTIIINILKSKAVDRMYPEIVCKGKLSTEVKKGLYKRIAGLLLFKISGICRNSFDSIVLSTFLGLVVLAKYQNYYCIIGAIVGILGIITDSISAGIGDSIASEDIEKNYKDFNTLYFIINWIAGFCTVCLICLYQPFMVIWVGEEYLFPFYMVIMFGIYFYSQQLGNVAFVYRQATGLWWEDKMRPIVESVINLVLNVVSVKFFGVAGVLLSTIITIIFINIPWASYILFKHYFQMNVRKYWIKMVCGCFPTILATILSYLLCTFLPGLGIIPLLTKGIICFIVSNLVLLLFYYRTEEFSRMCCIIKKILNIQNRAK